MRTTLAVAGAIVAMGLQCQALIAAGPYDNLLLQVPAEANLLVLIDAEQVRASEFVKAQKLAAEAPDAAANSSFVPPKEINQAVLAAKIRGFRESLVDWQTALLNLNVEPSLTRFAASYQGRIEQLGKQDYVAMPNGAMALTTRPKVLTVLNPLDRKRASQALSLAALAREPKLSPFLTKMSKLSGLKTDAVIAIDLEDMFPHSRVLIYLQESKAIKAAKVDVLKASRLLQTLQGIALKLKFTSEVQGEIVVEFGSPTTGSGEWTKDLLLEVLNDTGATIEDLDSWTYARTDKQITFSGSLTMTALRRVFSLVDFPTSIPDSDSPTAELPPEEAKRRTAAATLARFKSTERLLNDVRDPKNTGRLSTAEYGMWFDSYARKIDALPSLNVDKEMLDYCDDVTLRLRVMATQFRLVGIKAGQYSRSTPHVVSYFYNWYGSRYTFVGDSRPLQSDHDYVHKVERAAAATDKVMQYQEIDKSTTQIRRTMTDRYQVEF